uniref:GOLGA2L5 domain-containing protein n=1 Tax=Macrostomum lignano TaxID=282301 RepID=A0A1I8GL01_9PLAT
MSSIEAREAAADGIHQLHANIIQQVQNDCRPDLLQPMLEAQFLLVQKLLTTSDANAKSQPEVNHGDQQLEPDPASTSAESLASTVSLLRDQLNSVTVQRDELQQRLLESNARQSAEAGGDELAKLKDKYARLVKQCKIFKETIRQLKEDQQGQPQQSVESQARRDELKEKFEQQDAHKRQLIEQLQLELDRQREQFEQCNAQKQQQMEEMLQQIAEQKRQLELQEQAKSELEGLKVQVASQAQQLELMGEQSLQMEQLQHQLEDQSQQLKLQDKEKFETEALKQEIEELQKQLKFERQNNLQANEVQQQLELNEMLKLEIEKLKKQLEEERQQSRLKSNSNYNRSS